MNIYKVTRANGQIEYRAGTRSMIHKLHYDNERLDFKQVEILQHNVSYKEVENHKLPILICV
jgi:hypothetical protein